MTTTRAAVSITDEMPAAWVRALADAIEARGWTVLDAYESAVVVELDADAAEAVHAAHGDRLVIGWAGSGEDGDPGEVHWGLSSDGAHVPHLDMLGGVTPDEISERAHRLLRTGRPEPRELRHAMPYAEISEACRCPTAHPCGGIVPDPDCPEHGDRRAPTMEWHWESACI
ncbi:hypothetical protein F0L17_26695 [Streptomyces sp. TRM43335]|uniref:Uncharacterized protein n=1 Tax=Streptomyces taklimakanensis TaxID=2569853 RepID=A0A6G2BKL6_9ACTN|nr:hypothetical protein [Streptomyces taklimakanensis]MTE22619.1 hypothetical protein [Streptomyces taklimakanensis]